MSTRIRGAVLALVAAGLVGAAVPLPWWSGHPALRRDDGTMRVIDSMSVEIGVLGFEGCRGVGGDKPDCKYAAHTEGAKIWNPGGAFAALGFATLGAGVLAALLLLVETVAAATGAVALRRKLAVAAIAGSGLAVLTGALFLALAPETHGVPHGVAPFLLFGGALIGIGQGVFAMRPDRERAPRAPRAPKPAKPPKPGKLPARRPDPVPIGAPPPGAAFPPIDFMALMEEPAPERPSSPTANLPPPWQSPAAPSSQLPGAAGVLGTNMPQPMYPEPPVLPDASKLRPMYEMPAPVPPPPAGPNGNGLGQGVPAIGPGAPTLMPGTVPPPMPMRGPPPPPTRPPPFQPAMPGAAGPPPFVPPMPGPPPPPQPPFVPPMPGAPVDVAPQPVAPSSAADLPSAPMVMSIAGPTLPPTAIPPIGEARPAPPPFRGAKTTAPPPFSPPIPAAAMAALARPADPLAVPPRRPDKPADHTAPSDAVPEGAENTDMGPAIDPPPPDDLDGRLDTSNDELETVERSGEEVAAARAAVEQAMAVKAAKAAAAKAAVSSFPPPVEPHGEDETVPRERPSAAVLTSAPKTPAAGVVAAPAAPAPIPISTASPDLPPPTAGQVSTDGPVPACPQCDSPMNWVEKHLRFYCASCRMYF